MAIFTLADCMVKTGQPCWDCAKACGGCSWSAKLEPIPGWTAREKSYPAHGMGQPTTTYAIKYCPEFEPEARR